ncbi:hypothetical protein SAMN03159353_10678 [Cedecea sp. NFIX57]|nr:hypothetical protein SAMN03159353_10678 [Cedecea sp. NFIX57]
MHIFSLLSGTSLDSAVLLNNLHNLQCLKLTTHTRNPVRGQIHLLLQVSLNIPRSLMVAPAILYSHQRASAI